MVVVDSAALIPLSHIGRLDLISATFEEIQTTAGVRREVLTEGKRGTGPLKEFLNGDGIVIRETPPVAENVASLEGIANVDAAVILLADGESGLLLANDKGLIEVARSHGVECWWVTTLLLHCTQDGGLTASEADDVLYELVNAGMNLHPKVYAQIQHKLQELGR